ncbi:hypothetical protein GXW83_25110 [Streptacidiphilus sp. PB12-B1b]|uniref:hypothetical protein n=1 Tax=Streptacidiphilus sp. PB12-B1b TaxID=2705012 RepID=UPI0015FE4FEE|nr:hypothetical protein [Streptacidiphilus sp. PB12-B1b]QMU78499.1 hypothetical protein GXW83_25110 [Streptacidiphilus sp. PB12-B1b]
MVEIPGAGRPDDVFDEPRSGRLVAWGNAVLGGAASPDDAAEAVRAADDSHTVRGVAGAEGAGLTLALGRLRALGVSGLRLARPVPGHPLGLTGPASFNQHALEAGEAVLTVGGPPLGLVPEAVVHGSSGDSLTRVVWHAQPVNEGVPADVPQLRDAERELAEGLREATAAMLRLDVAGGGPAVQRALESYRRRRTPQLLAPGYPPRAVRVLESARQVAALLALASVTEGAAVSAAEMAARNEALRPLGRTVRRAQVAAYNAMVDEPTLR